MFNKVPPLFYTTTTSPDNVTGYKMPIQVGPNLPQT
jgi:hypothetical protein